MKFPDVLAGAYFSAFAFDKNRLLNEWMNTSKVICALTLS